MERGGPTSQVAEAYGFEPGISAYAQRLSLLLRENPWEFWKKEFWTYGHWARRDSELQKILARTFGLLHEVLRLQGLDGPRISEYDQQRIQSLLDDPATLTLDAALELHDTLDRLVIEISDEAYVCAEIEGELQWDKGSTTWLTWSAMYDTSVAAVEKHRSGKPVDPGELAAARSQLLTFRRARSDDYQVHRARQKMRARNLRVLAMWLVFLVATFGWLLARRNVADGWPGVVLVGIAGALGAVMSGTYRARDKLVRGSDLRAFRAGLMAQVLLGAASSLIMLLVMASSIIVIAGTGSLEGKTVVGFVAGFSEPFFLGIIERVAKLGEDAGKESEKPRKTAKEGEKPA